MFYWESSINEHLKCKVCERKYDVPLILPCGRSICQSCQEDVELETNKKSSAALKHFKCLICEKDHQMPQDGLIVNQTVLNLVKIESIEISRGDSVKMVDVNLEILLKSKQELIDKIGRWEEIVNDHFEMQIQDIYNKTESRIKEMNEECEKLVNQLNKTREEYLGKFKDYPKIQSDDLKKAFEKMDVLNAEWKEMLNKREIKDEDAKMANKETLRLKSILDQQLYSLNVNRFCFFEDNKLPLYNNVIGILKLTKLFLC